jgi:hypothetical protein
MLMYNVLQLNFFFFNNYSFVQRSTGFHDPFANWITVLVFSVHKGWRSVTHYLHELGFRFSVSKRIRGTKR